MTLEDVFRLVLRRWWLVLAAVLVGAGLGYAYESSKPDTFEATGRIVIGPALDDPDSIIESTGSLTRGTLPQTLAEMVTGSEVREVAEAGLSSPAGAAYEVESIVIPQTSVIEVVVTGPDRDTMLALTGALLQETEAVFEGLYPIYDVALLDAPNGPRGPVSPDPALGAIIGALAGAMSAVLLAIALHKRRDDGEEPPVAPELAPWHAPTARRTGFAEERGSPEAPIDDHAVVEPVAQVSRVDHSTGGRRDDDGDAEPAGSRVERSALEELTEDGADARDEGPRTATEQLAWYEPTWGLDPADDDDDEHDDPTFHDPLDEVTSVAPFAGRPGWLEDLESPGDDRYSKRR